MEYFLKLYDIKDWYDYNLYCVDLPNNKKIETLLFYAIYNYDKNIILTERSYARCKKIIQIVNNKKSDVLIKKIDNDTLQKMKNYFYKF